MRMPSPPVLAIFYTLYACLLIPTAFPQTLTDLGTLGGTTSQAFGINNNGQIVGMAYDAHGSGNAFLYSNGVMTSLGTLGRAGSWAYAISSSGQIVGTSYATVGQHAFLYSGGNMSDISAALGVSIFTSIATAINDSTAVVGTYDNLGFVYSHGNATFLPVLPGGSQTQPNAINFSGQIVGQTETAALETHAFLYSGGTIQDLGMLSAGLGSSAGSIANGINNSGQIVGYSVASDGNNHAFLYADGVWNDLGTLGGLQSAAYAINSSGQVVGYSMTAQGSIHAFIYSNGVMTDLESLAQDGAPCVFQFAQAINDAGQVVGTGYCGNILQHALLLDLTRLTPPAAAAEGPSFDLTVTGFGTDFVPGATVNWNGSALPTSYVSATEMTATVAAGLIAHTGTAAVTVTSGATTLARTTFAIKPPRPTPSVPERPRPGRGTAKTE